jgi:signal peptidase I
VRTPSPVILDGEAMAHLLAGIVARGASVLLVARGGSMSPWIRDGDVVTVAPVSGGDVHVPVLGDVVACRQPGGKRLVIHRLVSRRGDGWIVKGDRCPAPDGFLAGGAVLGVVVRATRNGRRSQIPQGLPEA